MVHADAKRDRLDPFDGDRNHLASTRSRARDAAMTEAETAAAPCPSKSFFAIGDFEPRVKRSPSRRALRIHVERVERMARRHEYPVALDAAEADIRGALGQCDEADGLAGRVENLHAVLLRATHAPAAPQIAVDVASETIRRAARLGGDEGT